MKPTERLMEFALKMEREFQRFHGNSIDGNPKVFVRLKDVINAKYPGIEDFAVMCFVRTRTFIRMKAINKKKKCKGNKRTEGEQRQKVKKMKKVAT